jgi:hypothetical protein
MLHHRTERVIIVDPKVLLEAFGNQTFLMPLYGSIISML